MRHLVLAFALAATLAGPASALSEDERSRFQFRAKCGPVDLEVTSFIPDEVIKSEGRNPETMIETVQTAVRSRLRAARIYAPPDSVPFGMLEFVIDAADADLKVVRVSITFTRHLFDPFSGNCGWSASWRNRGFAFSDALSVQAGELTDGFIDEYPRVNAVECD